MCAFSIIERFVALYCVKVALKPRGGGSKTPCRWLPLNDFCNEAPFGAPRWVCDSWEELKQILEETYDDLKEDGCIEDSDLTPEERYINSLSNNGARIKAPDGTTEPVSMDFYRRAVEACIKGGCNAITYELELPGIDGEFMIAIWKSGHVDSGSAERILQVLDR